MKQFKKRTWYLPILILLILSGCQENPDKDVVVNKNEGALDNKMLESGEINYSEDVPESYNDSFTNIAGDVEVMVDADIHSVQSDLPVVRVKPHEISESEVKLWGDVLF